MYTVQHYTTCIGIKLSIYIQQNWKVQLQETSYINKIYFSLYANCSLITCQPNRANLIWQNREFKGYYKSTDKGILKWTEKIAKLEAKNHNFYHLQFDAVETCQSCPLELADDYE